MDSVGLGLIGALPLVAFALFGLVAPRLASPGSSRWNACSSVPVIVAASIADSAGWRVSRSVWVLAAIMAMPLLLMYSTLAWGPQMPVEIGGVTLIQAGPILAAYSLCGVPSVVLAPVLVAGCSSRPHPPPLLWRCSAGLGPLLDPVLLVLINLRSRTPESTVALSGFVQGTGYSVGR